MKKYILLAMVLMVAIASSATTVVKVRTKDSRKVMPFYADSVDNIFYDIYQNQHCLNFKMKNDNLEYFLVGDVIEVKHHIIDPTQESEEATVSGKIGDYDYVDLELPSGNLWATYNVGATNPSEIGNLFAWGETEAKEEYIGGNYKYLNKSIYCKKMPTRKGGDNKFVLDKTDDAVNANWGDAWRMPRKSECIELMEGCTWKWTSNYNGTGVSGMIGKSIKNHNVIFIPSTNPSNLYGNYWTSSVFDDGYSYTVSSIFTVDVDTLNYSYPEQRFAGLPVRGVAGIQYTVKFYGKDGILLDSQKVDQNQAAIVPNARIDDYIFKGWNDSSFTKVTKDLEVYAVYEKRVIKDGVTVSGQIDGYDYVDLGLPSGLKWATYNVGASKPLECGDYFAWAETSPKEVYNWNTLKYYDPSGIGELVKYNFDRNNGYVDNLEYLESIDDAAYVNWGEKWKTPYNSQQIEMVDGCTWKWVENFEESGLSGYLGTSKYNENTIFFPLAGRMENSSNSEKGVLGSYWSNSIKYENSLNGLILDFVRGSDETEILIESKFIAFRDLGLSIRAVSE